MILLDGAMGTELRARGCSVPSYLHSIWSAQVLLDSPQTVCKVHEDYIAAGADVIITNNYAVTQDILGRVGKSDQTQFLTQLSVELAKQARAKSGRNVKIAGSLPPLNTSYRADLVGKEEDVIRKYDEILEVLTPQVDLIIIESMSSIEEAQFALHACRDKSIEIWLSYTLHGSRQNTLPSGEHLSMAIDQILNFDPNALLLNCSTTNQINDGIDIINRHWKKAFGGYANPERILSYTSEVGIDLDPESSRKTQEHKLDISTYIDDVSQWISKGATIIGGCCRTSPKIIMELNKSLMKSNLR